LRFAANGFNVRWLRALAAIAALLALSPTARGEIFGSSFRSAAWGVELSVPRGWELSEQASYPGILVRAVERRGGGRLTLAAERLRAGERLPAFVDRAEKSLRKLRWRFTTSAHSGGATIVDAVTVDGKVTVRQAYLEREGVAYVLTMAAPADAAQRYLHPFDDVLRNLSFSAAEPEPETP
jgi:hypothetical protein